MEEYNVILSSLANQVWVNVIDWYNSKKEGLGFEVFDEIDEYLVKLKSTPLIHRRIDGEIRISLTPRFHFAIFYCWKYYTCNRNSKSKRKIILTFLTDYNP